MVLDVIADLSLTHQALQDAVQKCSDADSAIRSGERLVADHGLSVCQACRAVRLARSAFYTKPRPRDDAGQGGLTANGLNQSFPKKKQSDRTEG